MMTMDLFRSSDYAAAVFGGHDAEYRYWLLRVLGPGDGKIVVFCMLNPSTADEVSNDPTIRRCIGYARAWGAVRLIVVNAFAIRGPHPSIINAVADPVGPENDLYIQRAVGLAMASGGVAVAAWGDKGTQFGRAAKIIEMVGRDNLRGLDFTKAGNPKHPLRLAGSLLPVPLKLSA